MLALRRDVKSIGVGPAREIDELELLKLIGIAHQILNIDVGRGDPSVAGVAALLVLAQPLAAQAPDPIVRTEGLRQVSPHVHIIPDNSVPMVPNVGFVVGERGVLVIDTGMGRRNGAAVVEVAKKLSGARELYLVTTHFHP